MNPLIRKYNVPGPRYTSYPTVPFWNPDTISPKSWESSVRQSFNESNETEGISIYIHLPYCESLCTFCGCNKRITKNHNVETPYIETVLKEWKTYLNLFSSAPKIREIHLGGGTPTFFSTENLEKLIQGIYAGSQVMDDVLLGFEGHPNNTTYEHLKSLRNLGFNRVSFGVQDYDPLVQKTINRVQPFENVKQVTEWSRELGYESLSHDLVFGLPHQKVQSIEESIQKTVQLRPDRIAFYSYAHVPWIKGVGQRGFDENDLPKDEEKRTLYERGRELLEEAGYHEIGMDHFALTSDSLYASASNETLHRNFMGYTNFKTQLMIGLGVSAIGDSWYGFAQNKKTVEEYTQDVDAGILPFFRGHILNKEDLIIRQHILNIMCKFHTSWEAETLQFDELNEVVDRLKSLEADGLLILHANGLQVTEKGRPFIRNICMAFDLLLLRNKPETQLFSMTI